MASIFEQKVCKSCGMSHPADQYPRVASPFIDGDKSPYCTGCLSKKINFADMNSVDAFCRWANLPFLPDEWMRIYQDNPADVLMIYTNTVLNGEYRGLDWKTVNDFWQSEVEKGQLFENFEELKREFVDRMKMKWQLPASYDEYVWLENFYREMSKVQNLTNPATKDILQKLCKISLQIDRLSRDSDENIKEIKDLTGVYTSLLKSSGFIDAKTGGANTINSVGQLYQLMEQKNFQPTFYNGEAQDLADKTIDDMKKTTKRLLMGDGSIAEILEAKLQKAGIPMDIEETDDATDFMEEIALLKAAQEDRKKAMQPHPKNGVTSFKDDIE